MPEARKPRLLVLNQYYWPGVEATAQLLTDLCEALAEDLYLATLPDPALWELLHAAQGFVRVAFRLAFWELLHAPSFEAALIDVVNRGGDALHRRAAHVADREHSGDARLVGERATAELRPERRELVEFGVGEHEAARVKGDPSSRAVAGIAPMKQKSPAQARSLAVARWVRVTPSSCSPPCSAVISVSVQTTMRS